MALTENLTSFFADFGVAATVGGVSVTGIFDKAYIEALGYVNANNPVLLVLSSVSASEGTAVTVNATSYTVASIEPDGTGLTLLQLEAA